MVYRLNTRSIDSICDMLDVFQKMFLTFYSFENNYQWIRCAPVSEGNFKHLSNAAEWTGNFFLNSLGVCWKKTQAWSLTTVVWMQWPMWTKPVSADNRFVCFPVEKKCAYTIIDN